jgi:hypothetical protein
MRTRSVAVIASLAASLMAAPAFADATFTWNTKDNGSYTGNSSQYTFSANGNPNEKVKVRAYSLSGLTTSSTFQNSSVGVYSGGLGVTSSGESGSPQHAVDNSGRYDFLLFEFDNSNYKNFGFQIGWKDTDSDVQVWVGDAAAGLNLTNAAACNSSCDFTDLGLMGFNAPETFDNVALNTTKSVSGQLSGRYLLVAGKLSSSNDFFKVSLINGIETTRQVAEPSSLALVAMAVAGVGFVGRRRRRAT